MQEDLKMGDSILQKQRANLRRVHTISTAHYKYKEIQTSNLSRTYSIKLRKDTEKLDKINAAIRGDNESTTCVENTTNGIDHHAENDYNNNAELNGTSDIYHKYTGSRDKADTNATSENQKPSLARAHTTAIDDTNTKKQKQRFERAHTISKTTDERAHTIAKTTDERAQTISKPSEENSNKNKKPCFKRAHTIAETLNDTTKENRKPRFERANTEAKTTDDAKSGNEKTRFERSHTIAKTSVDTTTESFEQALTISKATGDNQQPISQYSDDAQKISITTNSTNKNNMKHIRRPSQDDRRASLGHSELSTSNLESSTESHPELSIGISGKELQMEENSTNQFDKSEISNESKQKEYQILRENVELKRQVRELAKTLEDTQSQLNFAKRRVKEMNNIIRGKIEKGLSMIDENGNDITLMLKTKHDQLLECVEKNNEIIRNKDEHEKELKCENKKLETEITATKKESKKILEETKSEIQNLENKKKRMELNVEKMKNEETKLKYELQALQTRHDTLEKQFKHESDELKETILKYDEELNQLNNEYQVLEETRTEQTSNLGKIIAESEIAIAESNKEKQKIKEDTVMLKDVIATLEESVGELTTTKEEIEQKLEDMTRDHDVTTTQLFENEQLYREEKKLIFQQAKKFETLLHDCDEQLSERENQCNELQKNYEEERVKNHELAQKVEELTKLLSVQGENINELKESLANVEESFNETETKYDLAMLDKEENEKQLFELTEQLETLKEDLNKQRNESESLEKFHKTEIENMEEESKEKIKDWEEKIETMLKENAEKLDNETQTLTTSYENQIKNINEKAKEREESFQEEIEQLTEGKEKLLQSHKDKIKEIKRLKGEVKRLQPLGGWKR